MRHPPSLPSHTTRLFRGRSLVVAIAALASFLTNESAGSQIFTGVEPRQPLVIPHVGSSISATVAAPTAAASGTAIPGARTGPDILHHMPRTLEGLEITGETGDLRWPVYLTSAQARQTSRFRLGYQSAVSVLDETSSLTLRINGHAVGSIAIHAPQGVETHEFEIPAGVLQPGYNALSVSAQQRHRVDCSVAATYELWTRIDPAETGLVVGNEPINDLGIMDTPALLPSADGTLPIHIQMNAKVGAADIERLLKATQWIALAGTFQQPAVDFGPTPDDPWGINLILGLRPSLQALPADIIGTTGPLANLVTLPSDTRPTLIITGSSDQDLDDAIASLPVAMGTLGSPEGLAAARAYPGLPSSGDTRLTLKDFGLESQEFSGHRLRHGLNLLLPPDFLSADYARGTFDLAGGYAGSLTHDAQVRVDINGRNAGEVKLPRPDGDVFRHNPMFLPLSLMRPGLNRIDIIAEVPKANDAACDMSKTSAEDNRFLLLDSSVLALPRLARAGRLPDLALMASGGLPFTGTHPVLFVPKPDRDAMAAALSLVARAAVAAGRVLPFSFTITPPSNHSGPTLVVAPARALDPRLMRENGLDPDAVESAWRDLTRTVPEHAASNSKVQWWTTDRHQPPACLSLTPARAVDRTGGVGVTGNTTVSLPGEIDLFDRWRTNVHEGPSWLDGITRIPSQAAAFANRAMDRFGSSSDDILKIPSNTSLILAQAMASGSPDSVTTIVTAPTSAMLKASISCLADPQTWTQIRGRLSTLDGATGHVDSIEAARFHYIVTSPLSIGNSRLVLAGWFSLNPLAFMITTLLSALCLSGTTMLFVKGIGRKGNGR